MITTIADKTIVNTFLQLPEQVKEQVFNYMKYLIVQYQLNITDPEINQLLDKKQKQRKLGGLEGKIWISDDFNEPLADFKEYM